MTQSFVFTGQTVDTGSELWITDGTESGTKLLKDLAPGTVQVFGTDFVNSSNPGGFAAVGGGYVLFGAQSGIATNGGALYVTDGTATGTEVVKEFAQGAPTQITPFTTHLGSGVTAQKVLFAGNDGVSGSELWISDGTPSGTHLLKDIYPGYNGSSISNIFDFGDGNAIFNASDGSTVQAWVTDGTVLGTHALSNSGVDLGETQFGYGHGDNGSPPIKLADGKFLFNGFVGGGSYPWVTDGTSAGTTLFSTKEANPQQFTDLGNGEIIFSGYDAVHGFELWRTDGHDLGTELVADINPLPASNGPYGPDPYSSDPYGFTALGNGKAVFGARDGDNSNVELWVTDGTASGTSLVADLNPGPNGSYPNAFFAIGGGRALFMANGLWVTDGTSGGTRQISTVRPGGGYAASVDFTAIGDGRFLFSGGDKDHGEELWVTDGTSAGTMLLKDVDPTFYPSSMGGDPESGVTSNSTPGLTAVGPLKSAAEYIQQYLAQAHSELDNPLFPGGPHFATDEEIANRAYQDAIGDREKNALTSARNLALRDTEYFFRGYVGGLEQYLGKPLLGTDANELANRLGPISTAVYNAKKVLTGGSGSPPPGELPGTPPGGYEVNVYGWTKGRSGEPLSQVVAEFAASHPSDQTFSSDPAAPTTPFSVGNVNLDNGYLNLALFVLKAPAQRLGFIDPVASKEYDFGFENNTVTGILVPTSVTTSPITVTFDGLAPVTIAAGTTFDITSLEPGGASSIKIQGDFSDTSAPSFGFTFSQEAETLVAELQAAVSDTAAPAVLSVSVTGSTLSVTYNEALDALKLPAPTSFAVLAGGNVDAVTGASVSGATLSLTLATAVTLGQAVTLSYTDPTPDNDASAIQDLAGNDAGTFTALPVTNTGSGAGGSPSPVPGFSVKDNSTGATTADPGQPYTGPVAGLEHQYINTSSDNLSVSANVPNVFVHTGSGFDAIDVSGGGGTNVLDGGTGSNFLVGGKGPAVADTFFVDDRGPSADIWSTMVNFHAGDAATLFGVTQQGATLNWENNQGAAGYTGLTLHAFVQGAPTASLTLTGFSTDDLTNGRLSTSFGTEQDGTPYLYIHANS